jgi:hypothetical protein
VKSVKATKSPKAVTPPSKGGYTHPEPSYGKGKGDATAKATKSPKAVTPPSKGGYTHPELSYSPSKGKGIVVAKATKSPKNAKESDHVQCVEVPNEDECCYCECCLYPSESIDTTAKGKGKGVSSKGSAVKAKGSETSGKGSKGKGKGAYRQLMGTSHPSIEDFPPENCSCACDEQCYTSKPASPTFVASGPKKSSGTGQSSTDSSVADGSSSRTTDSVTDAIDTEPTDDGSGAEDSRSDVDEPYRGGSSRTNIFPWLVVGVVGSCLSLYLLKRARSAVTVDDMSLSV